MIVYKLSKDNLILGPLQIEAMIDQDTTIARQLTLWDQRGSRVIRGNLLSFDEHGLGECLPLLGAKWT